MTASCKARAKGVKAGISDVLSVCAPAAELWDPVLPASVVSFPRTAMTQPASVFPHSPPRRSASPRSPPSHTQTATLLPATLSAKIDRAALGKDVFWSLLGASSKGRTCRPVLYFCKAEAARSPFSGTPGTPRARCSPAGRGSLVASAGGSLLTVPREPWGLGSPTPHLYRKLSRQRKLRCS